MSTYIQDQFKKAAETLEYLGIPNPFNLEDIKVSPSLQTSLKKHKAVMIITPRIDASFTYRDLIAKLDTVATYDTYVYKPTWKDYKGTQEPSISFVYMDGDNSYKGEDGLYGCNKTAQQQVTMLKKMPGDVRSINPVEYIMLFTMYRDKPLDRYTWTRFLDDAFRRGEYSDAELRAELAERALWDERHKADKLTAQYGEYEIPDNWKRIDRAYIWFQAFNHTNSPGIRRRGWGGVRGYVYKTPEGYVAPFRGQLVPVVKDTRDKFREVKNEQAN